MWYLPNTTGQIIVPPIRKVGKVGRKILEGNMMGNVLSGVE